MLCGVASRPICDHRGGTWVVFGWSLSGLWVVFGGSLGALFLISTKTITKTKTLFNENDNENDFFSFFIIN